jgi:hypothetical protein
MLGHYFGTKILPESTERIKTYYFCASWPGTFGNLDYLFGSQCTGDASAAGEKYAKCLLVNNSKLHCFMQVGLQIICFAAAAGLEVE